MRRLFTSETRCISNMIRMKWGVCIESELSVLREYYSEAARQRTGHVFNCDFALEFVDRFVTWPDTMATAASILPNTLGAEVFLIVEKGTFNPMALELIGGEAFPVKHYASLIEVVEAAVQEAMESARRPETEYPWKELMEVISMQKAAFARLLVVGSDATFLYFPTDTTPLMRGQCLNLAQGDDREIHCYVDGHQIVCFDGWVRTHVTRTERMLVALPEDNA